MKKSPSLLPMYVVAFALCPLLGGCPVMPPPDGDDGDGNGGDGDGPAQGFVDADAARGGALYDKWWKVAGVTAAEPTGDHPFWASRPDTQSNTRMGSTTWRCKECHGWDYKGLDGAYGSGSHRTGFAGIFGTTQSASEAFDLIKTDHGYGNAGLSDDDLWDLAKFVLEGQIDTDDLIDVSAAFVGNLDNGQTLYDFGIGTGTACIVCHGADGLLAPPGSDPNEHDEFVGLIANENPWEFQHKVRFGQPGTAMSASVADGGTTQDVADLGAYAQSLPEAPEDADDAGNGGDDGNGGVGDNGGDADNGAVSDPAAGEAFFVANNCALCHCADAIGGCLPTAPSLVGEESADILDRLTGVIEHTGRMVEGAAQQDADDLAAWLASL